MKLRHLLACSLLAVAPFVGPLAAAPKTTVSIAGDKFFINGKPTYEGRTWKGKPIEGLMMNSRMVQGVFDDLNPETVSRWAYPDTGKWDAERNVREFLAAMPALARAWPALVHHQFPRRIARGLFQGSAVDQQRLSRRWHAPPRVSRADETRHRFRRRPRDGRRPRLFLFWPRPTPHRRSRRHPRRR